MVNRYDLRRDRLLPFNFPMPNQLLRLLPIACLKCFVHLTPIEVAVHPDWTMASAVAATAFVVFAPF
jgi:hypothetical protein